LCDWCSGVSNLSIDIPSGRLSILFLIASWADIWVSDLLKQLKLQVQRELDLPRSAGAMPSKTKLLSSSPRPAKRMLRWLLPPVSTALGTNAVSVDQFSSVERKILHLFRFRPPRAFVVWSSCAAWLATRIR
jgi:hypothetical protein